MPFTILITGATGLIGLRLIKFLSQKGSEIIAVSQNVSNAQKILPAAKKIISWNELDSLMNEKFDAVINLAGTNLDAKRWNGKFRKEIYDSRIESTRKIAGLIKDLPSKPEVFINASGVDYYGDTGDREIDEHSPHEDSFIGNLVYDWEQEASRAKHYGVRVVCLRTGFVIAHESKAFKKMMKPYKLFVGGYPGNGKQYLAWIDINDLVDIYLFCVENKSISGGINASSPNPVRMKEFSHLIGKILQRPSFFPAPAFLLNLFFGGIARLILSGRKAKPGALLKAGFTFKYPDVSESLSKELNQ
ncbi:MAG: TIGR01777 family oxidoreductase [Ignavibacteria bacterium]